MLSKWKDFQVLQSSNYDSWVSVKLGCIPLQCCRSEIIAFNVTVR